MEDNVQGSNPLTERIGIDRSVLCDFGVTAVDTKQLSKAVQKKGQYASLINDRRSPIELADGSRIGKLVVKDQRIGKLSVSFERNQLQDGRTYVRSRLELTVSAGQNNLQNLTSAEYLLRIQEVFDLLEHEYGITADYAGIRIKQLEINATFILNEPYERYRYPILMMIRNVPARRYKSGANNAVKYASWHESDHKTGKDTLETAIVRNSTTELKIYDKTKHLKDLGVLPPELIDKSVMRVEYKLKEKAIKTAFGDTLAVSLTDPAVTDLFMRYFNRDVIQQYRRWKNENHKQLIQLTKKHRELNQHWTSSFLRECRQYEVTHRLPILFDLNDMRSVIKDLESGKNRNAMRKFNQFKKQSIYESDLSGNTERIEEIIKKIQEMNLS